MHKGVVGNPNMRCAVVSGNNVAPACPLLILRVNWVVKYLECNNNTQCGKSIPMLSTANTSIPWQRPSDTKSTCNSFEVKTFHRPPQHLHLAGGLVVPQVHVQATVLHIMNQKQPEVIASLANSTTMHYFGISKQTQSVHMKCFDCAVLGIPAQNYTVCESC